jgi:HK97 gp10 family phage protein
VAFTVDIITKTAEAALNGINSAVKRADTRAVRVAARYAVAEVRKHLNFSGDRAPADQLGRRSGKLYRQVGVKYFRKQDGLRGASVRVRGDRSFIMRFHERGTSQVPARHIFEKVGRSISDHLASLYEQEFDLNFRLQVGL